MPQAELFCDPDPKYETDEFQLMTDELLKLVGVTHSDTVREAVRRGLRVPPEVRVYHPEHFVDIPDRFGLDKVEMALRPEWNKYVTAESLERRIAVKHESIALMKEHLSKRLSLNPGLERDEQEFIERDLDEIDFLRWLEPLVSEGGVFYTGQVDVPPESEERGRRRTSFCFACWRVTNY